MISDQETPLEDEIAEAGRALAAAESVEDFARLRQQSQAMHHRLQAGRFAREIWVQEAVLRLRVEHSLGRRLRAQRLAHGAAGNQHTGRLDRYRGVPVQFLLRDLEVSKKVSSRAQRIGAIPDEVFESYLSECEKALRPPSYEGALRLAAVYCQGGANGPEKAPQGIDAGTRLTRLIAAGQRFATIFAAPEWPHEAATSRRAKRFVKAAADEPVRLVAAENCSLHLWTPTRFLGQALELIQAWEFTFVSLCIDVPDPARETNYWNSELDFLLLGVRGEPVFADRQAKCIVKLDGSSVFLRETIVKRIERVNPGPYLELYGSHCRGREDWTCCDQP